MTLNSKEWRITEHSEYKNTIQQTPRSVRDYIDNQLKPQMENNPFLDAIRLRNKCDGLYEQKIGKYRLVYRMNINSKVVEFLWIRAKPHATAKCWVS